MLNRWSTRWPGRAGERPYQIRPLGQRSAETAQQRAALLQADQGIVAVDLKMLCQHRGIDTRQCGMIDAQGMAGVGGEEPGAEHLNAGDGKPPPERVKERPVLPSW